MNSLRSSLKAAALLVSLCLCALQTPWLSAQSAVELPSGEPSTARAAQSFTFVSDGPAGPGWSRPNEIARIYFHDPLPALFTRTIRIDQDLPSRGRLSWIFTGPRAGFTVELTPTKVRLFERYYDSFSLYSGQGNYPEKTVRDDERQFVGHARTLTVIAGRHLSIQVLVNGRLMLEESCVFDVTRHQLMLSAPRTEHDVVTGALLAETPGETVVDLNPQEKHQTMLGFGGSPSIPAYASLTPAGKERYWQLIKRYNLLIDREYPMGTQLKPDMSNLEDLGDATPHYYGDNFPNSEVSSFEYSRHILDLGGSVIYELWGLPTWAMEDYHGAAASGSNGRTARKVANPEEYARIVVTYCKLAQAHTGRAPAIVGIQNEVEEPPEIFDAIVLAVRRELDKAGFQSTKIHMADASFMYLGIDRARILQRDPEVWKAIDFAATHEYDFQEFMANLDMYDVRLRAMRLASGDKPFLATEICVNDPHYQEPSYRIAFSVAQLYHKNLVELDAVGLLYCWTLLDVEQPSFGGSRSLLIPERTDDNMPAASSFELRVLGAYSRHIRKGMTRIGAASDNPDLLAGAYANGKDETLVMLNRSTSVQRVTLHAGNVDWKQIEHTSLYSENGDSPVTSPLTEITVNPGEIVTLSTIEAE